VALVFNARLRDHKPTAHGWELGPARFPFRDQLADEEARASYFDLRACFALYGGDETIRWSRFATEDESRNGFRTLALELLRLPELPGETEEAANALLVIHGDLVAERPVETLYELARLAWPKGRANDDWLVGLANSAADLRPGRATTATFFTPATQLPAGFPIDQDYSDWSLAEQWLWLLASSTPFDRYPPTPGARLDLLSGTVFLSRDWRGLVLRDGIAFLGLRTDGGSEDPFFNDAEVYFRTIYLDALLLGIVQRKSVGQIADALACLEDPLGKPDQLYVLHRHLLEVRNRYWWQHVTAAGPASDILDQYQRQHRLEELSSQIFVELAEYAGQMQAASSERTNALLGLLTLVGIPVGTGLAVLQTLHEDNWEVIVVTVLGGLFVTSIFFLTIGRSLITPMLRSLGFVSRIGRRSSG